MPEAVSDAQKRAYILLLLLEMEFLRVDASTARLSKREEA